MPDDEECTVCTEFGREECILRRAAFMNEPFLSPGFEIGARWTSYDNGMTWHRFPPPPQPDNGRRGHMTVVGIDVKTGTVTVKASDGS